jgi:hypothetical protein
MTPRAIAVDWSGARSGAERKIWLAEARDGALVRLECGRTRVALAHHLLDELARDSNTVVGLDFGFSYPAWYVTSLGAPSARELWAQMSDDAERIIAACEAPFWGRPGVRRTDCEQWRRSERELLDAGYAPKSMFQLGGAGAVGTGSLRGMFLLRVLRDAGCAIWPFDTSVLPLVLEIYPRLLTGPVVKSSRDARVTHLAPYAAAMTPAMVAEATASEDAFDAAISAIEMSRRMDELRALPADDDPVLRCEGAIWPPVERISPRR